MDFAGIVDVALPVVYVLVGAVLVWFVVELALTIRSTRSTIDDAHAGLAPTLKNVEKITAQVDPLIAHVDSLVTDQIDPLLTRVNEIAEEAKPAVGRVDPLVERLSLTVDAANLELMRVAKAGKAPERGATVSDAVSAMGDAARSVIAEGRDRRAAVRAANAASQQRSQNFEEQISGTAGTITNAAVANANADTDAPAPAPKPADPEATVSPSISPNAAAAQAKPAPVSNSPYTVQ